ncbi:hypothetical protein OH76DRAFT_27493 [Lentinus brumalis]|uniref:Uncharacterized protein n=1 Tax=Lentinus brumalis TaxID=2498619 RepID=A0A371DXI9_9APHY|nr:hypothetical protein OH76DRAFT_27493 [Polyporus brumalis]
MIATPMVAARPYYRTRMVVKSRVRNQAVSRNILVTIRDWPCYRCGARLNSGWEVRPPGSTCSAYCGEPRVHLPFGPRCQNPKASWGIDGNRDGWWILGQRVWRAMRQHIVGKADIRVGLRAKIEHASPPSPPALWWTLRSVFPCASGLIEGKPTPQTSGRNNVTIDSTVINTSGETQRQHRSPRHPQNNYFADAYCVWSMLQRQT